MVYKLPNGLMNIDGQSKNENEKPQEMIDKQNESFTKKIIYILKYSSKPVIFTKLSLANGTMTEGYFKSIKIGYKINSSFKYLQKLHRLLRKSQSKISSCSNNYF